MDSDSSRSYAELPWFEGLEEDSSQTVRPSRSEVQCLICTESFDLSNEIVDSLESLVICAQCRMLQLRRMRRDGLDSPNSSEDSFAQQFSRPIDLDRTGHEADVHSLATARQHAFRSSTPNQSQRWRQQPISSDNESDNLDYADSVIGEVESNISINGYGGDSDAPFGASERSPFHGLVDYLYPESEQFTPQAFRDSYEDGEVSDWDELLIDETATVIIEQRQRYANSNMDPGSMAEVESHYSISDIDEPANLVIEHRQYMYNTNAASDRVLRETANVIIGRQWDFNSDLEPSSFEGTGWNNWRTAVGNGTNVPNIFAGLEGLEFRTPFAANPDDYVDARQFEELLEQLAENDNSRRGAPPASASFVKNLPSVIISPCHEKDGEVICAVCKDLLPVDTEAAQLPCMHLYHFPCIVPWLSTRNSCPVCRYELPTDDPEYEETKRAASREETLTDQLQQHDIAERIPAFTDRGGWADEVEVDHESSEEERNRLANGAETVNNSEEMPRRGRWFFFAAAAPIVTLVGLVLVFCFRRPPGDRNEHCDNGDQINAAEAVDRKRRWWSLF